MTPLRRASALGLACITALATLTGCGEPASDPTAAIGAGSAGHAEDSQRVAADHADHAVDASATADPTSPASDGDAAPPTWRAPVGPAPWDDGYPREWFYAHPREADDWRWARMAQHVGHPAPELRGLVDWRHGEPASLADWRGDIVLLKFWATWCSDCRASVESTEATAARLADQGLRVLEICAQKGGEAYADSLESWGLEQPAALDAQGLSEAAYDVPRWPFYVLIGRDGVVRATGLRSQHVDAALDLLLEREAARDR